MFTAFAHFPKLSQLAAFATTLFSAFAFATANAGYAVENLDLNDSAGASYARDIVVSTSGSDVFVRSFVTPTAPNDRKHRVNVSSLPAGLTPVSYSVTDSDCSAITNASIWSTGFSYEFPGDCDGVFVARFKTSGLSA